MDRVEELQRQIVALRQRLAALEKAEEQKRQAEEALRQRTAELEHINARLRMIVESTRGLTPGSEIRQLGPALLEEFARTMAATGGSMYLRTETALVHIHSLDPGHTPKSISLPLRPQSGFGRVLNSGKPLLIQDINREKNISPSGWKGYKSSSVLVFPLQDDAGVTVGLISLHDKLNTPFTPQDQQIGIVLTRMIFEKLQTARLLAVLQESEHMLELVLNSVPLAIHWKDKQGCYLGCNQNFARLAGLERVEQVIGKTAMPTCQLSPPTRKNCSASSARCWKPAPVCISGPTASLSPTAPLSGPTSATFPWRTKMSTPSASSITLTTPSR